MDVQFKRETLEDSDAIFADAFSGVTTAVNENYYTVKIAKDTYDASTAFEFKDASGKTLSYDFLDNRLYIYGDSGFAISSSKVNTVEKSLYDLNLSGNDVQTTSLVKVNSATNKINLEFKDDAGTMHSEEIVLKDDLSVSGVTCQDLQHALELFLRKTTFQNENNGTSKESTYGIYVVYVRDSSTAGEYEIRFGCDAKKMMKASSYSLESCSVDGRTCMVQDMRVSGAFDAEKDVDKITIDSQEIDVSECNTVASVYQKVKSSITGTDISLSFDGTNLVFTSANTLSIKKDSTAVSSDSEDFVIAPKNGSSIRVDLGNISSSTTLLEVVQKIETYLVGTTITIDYAGKDHIEFKSSGEFSIESPHTNKILKALGFGDKNKSVYYEEHGVGEYRVFGSPIGEMDWTELIKIGNEWSVNAGIKASLTNINASATLGFLGVGITASGELGYTLGFDSTNPQKTTEGLGTFTNKLNVDVNASIGGVDKKILNATNCALTDGSVIKFDNLVNTFKTSISLDPFLSGISNFSIETVYGMVTDFAKKIVEATDGMNFEIPLINKKVSDLVNVADSVLSVVDTLRAENVTDIQSFAMYFSKYLEDAGLTVNPGVSTSNPKIVDLKWDNVNKAIEFDFDLMKIFGGDDGFDLNFGQSGKGINGHANLGLTGGLWFKMSALVSANNGFVLKDSGIKFGANIGISGSKLSFDLGFNAGVTNMDLLRNLIKVGSDGDDSFIHMKASFEGEIGSDGSHVTAVTFDKDNPPYSANATILGRLPISIKGYTLGNIYLGKWNSASNTVVGGDINNYAVAKSMADVFGSLDVKNIGFSMLMSEADKSGLIDGTLVADFSEVYTKIQSLGSGDIDFFDKIKLAVAGLDELFTRIESGLNGKIMSQLKDMPVMGDALSNGVDFLSAIRDRVLEPFSDFVYESTGFNAKMIAEKLGELFTSDLTSVTGISQYGITDAWSLADGIAYRSGAEYAEWFLKLSDIYRIGTDLGFDLGMPGLEIAGDGGVSLEIGWNLQFGFGISEQDGFYFFFNEGDENEFTAGAKVHFAKGSKINGSISKLAMQLEMDDDDLAEFSFNVDLGQQRVNHISNVISSITPDVVARTNISAGITVGFGKIEDGSSSSKYPKFNGNFDFEWDVFKGVTRLGFSNMTIDVGTFVSNVLGPVVNRAKEVIEPMKELIDFLTTPFPVLDDLGVELTPLKLAKMYSKNPDFDDSFIFEVKEIVNIADKIFAFGKASKDGDVYIELPNYWLIGGINSSGSSAANNFIQGKAKSTTLDNSKYMDTTAKPTLVDPDGKVSSNGLSDIVNSSSSDSHWNFFWQDMQGAYRLLLGEDIDLVHYTMSPLNFEFSWDTFFPVYGPLGVRLDIAFGANINLGFGYDTYGIRQYIGSGWKDYGALVNGFYVDDLHNGKDSSELEFYGGVKASAEFNGGIIKGGVGGGVTITTGLDMFDPNEDGKLRLKEFKQTAEDFGVMGMFDLKGKISAELFAYVEFLFYTEEWDITGEITLFDFTANVNRDLDPVMAHEDEDEGDVIANVGDNSQERVYKGGANNSLEDGQETVEFELDGDRVIWKGNEEHSVTVDTSKGGRLIIKSGADVDRIVEDVIFFL